VVQVAWVQIQVRCHVVEKWNDYGSYMVMYGV
jgi:hypothetical protein